MSDPAVLATTPERASAPPASGNTGTAIGLTLFGMLLFSANDTLGKWLVET